MLDYLLEAFAGEGQLFMYAVTALLAFSVAVGLERGFFLGLKWRVDLAALTALLRQGKASEAAQAAGDLNHGLAQITRITRITRIDQERILLTVRQKQNS